MTTAQEQQDDQRLMFRNTPVWTERADNGGMFDCTLAVHRDDDPASTRPPFLASAKGGWGAGSCARRATLAEAIAHARAMFEKYL